MKNSVITKEVTDWFKALVANGMFVVDANGKGEFAPMVKDLMLALHQVLAGGDAEFRLKVAGHPATRNDLDKKLMAAMASINVQTNQVDEASP